MRSYLSQFPVLELIHFPVYDSLAKGFNCHGNLVAHLMCCIIKETLQGHIHFSLSTKNSKNNYLYKTGKFVKRSLLKVMAMFLNFHTISCNSYD